MHASYAICVSQANIQTEKHPSNQLEMCVECVGEWGVGKMENED